MGKPSEKRHTPEDVFEPQPSGESNQNRDGVGKKIDDHTQEASEHNERDKRYDNDIGDGCDNREEPKIDDDDWECENECRKTHREGFPEPEPFGEKRKYPSKEISKKEESKNRQEGEVETHIIIQNQWIHYHKSRRDSDEETESP